MGSYYYVNNSYQAAWSTSLPTTAFDDNSPGDTSSGVVANYGPQSQLTGFFDNGSAQTISAGQFTYLNGLGAGSPPSSPWILEGSNDSSTWSTITSATLAANSGYTTVTQSALSGSYRYFRLSLKIVGGGTVVGLYDWRLTLSSGGILPTTRVVSRPNTSFHSQF